MRCGGPDGRVEGENGKDSLASGRVRRIPVVSHRTPHRLSEGLRGDPFNAVAARPHPDRIFPAHRRQGGCPVPSAAAALRGSARVIPSGSRRAPGGGRRQAVRGVPIPSISDLECPTRLALFARVLAGVSCPDPRLRAYHDLAGRRAGAALSAAGHHRDEHPGRGIRRGPRLAALPRPTESAGRTRWQRFPIRGHATHGLPWPQT